MLWKGKGGEMSKSKLSQAGLVNDAACTGKSTPESGSRVAAALAPI